MHDANEVEHTLAELHVRRAVVNGTVVMVMLFTFGFIAGTGLRLWDGSRISALLAIAVPTLAAGLFAFAYYRTSGVLHHSGFGSHEKLGSHQ